MLYILILWIYHKANSFFKKSGLKGHIANVYQGVDNFYPIYVIELLVLLLIRKALVKSIQMASEVISAFQWRNVSEQSPDLPNITQPVNGGTEYPGVRAEAVEEDTARGTWGFHPDKEKLGRKIRYQKGNLLSRYPFSLLISTLCVSPTKPNVLQWNPSTEFWEHDWVIYLPLCPTAPTGAHKIQAKWLNRWVTHMQNWAKQQNWEFPQGAFL